MTISQRQNGDLLSLWASRYKLQPHQIEQFKEYAQLLSASNEMFNITAITQTHDIMAYHFADSLELGCVQDMTSIKSIADVGAGGGFPGMPLKIAYPHLTLYCIEVNKKKGAFLENVARELGLNDVIVIDLDWRTFLRKTSYEIDFFVARASLSPSELVRCFSPSFAYAQASLVYWASSLWTPEKKEEAFIERIVEYQIKDKVRKLVFFKG